MQQSTDGGSSSKLPPFTLLHTNFIFTITNTTTTSKPSYSSPRQPLTVTRESSCGRSRKKINYKRSSTKIQPRFTHYYYFHHYNHHNNPHAKPFRTAPPVNVLIKESCVSSSSNSQQLTGYAKKNFALHGPLRPNPFSTAPACERDNQRIVF